MNSLANQPSPDGNDLLFRASSLLQREVGYLEPTRGGGNNRLFKAHCGDDQYFAFKVYGTSANDPRDRMGAEVDGLLFLENNNVSAVPKVIAHDRGGACAAFEWIDGGPVNPPSVMDVDAALRFVAELNALGRTEGSDRLPLASAATLSGAAVGVQLGMRLARFSSIAEGDKLAVEAHQFLTGGFADAREAALTAAMDKYAAAGLDFDADIPPGRRILSPSDFGFHNALRRSGGRIAFVDFEYFGWDDPVKLLSDFLLHPGMTLSEPFKQRFFKGYRAIFVDQDSAFMDRFDALYPMYGLCWCLIMLNEFLPDVMARRMSASGGLDADNARAVQLDKATRMLAVVNQSIRNGAPYD